MDRSVLLIDDDEQVLRSISTYLDRSGYTVFRTTEPDKALELYDLERPLAVLLDLRMPGVSEFELLEDLVARGAAVLMLTGVAEVDVAVAAMHHGAENFLTKPVDMPYLLAALDRVAEKVRLRRQVELYRARGRTGGESVVLGTSGPMLDIERQIDVLAANERTTVLLTGESGTGKGVVARLIHERSARSDGPFVDVNCAGLSATFLDSELFGHEPGAFTDAKTRKEGLFEIASGGTLFLDEVGELALEVQPKLLKVLESRTFRRMGGTREITADTRLIAATNRDLAGEVEEGRFREDLYYRLSVVPLHLPPIRDRSRDDLIALIELLLSDLTRGRGGPAEIEPPALEKLVAHRWPGNVREMRNAIERAVIHAGNATAIGLKHLPPEIRGGRRATDGSGRLLTMSELERLHIERTVRFRKGNRTAAAKDLGISRATLINKIKKLKLDV